VDKLAFAYRPQPAEAPLPFADPAIVAAETAAHPGRRLRGRQGQIEHAAAGTMAAAGDRARLGRPRRDALAAEAQHPGDQPILAAANLTNLFGRPAVHSHHSYGRADRLCRQRAQLFQRPQRPERDPLAGLAGRSEGISRFPSLYHPFIPRPITEAGQQLNDADRVIPEVGVNEVLP
jgi:hypothetical protein